MPRVYTYRTRKRTKHADKGNYQCSKCGEDIVEGQSRYEWSFRYGGTFRRHVDCGYPKPSELTQSKMGQVYAATEDLVTQLSGDEWAAEDVHSYLEEAAEAVREVASEYEEAAQNFGSQGENQDRYEALDAYADELSSADFPEEPDDSESEDEWRERVRSAVDDAVGQCPY